MLNLIPEPENIQLLHGTFQLNSQFKIHASLSNFRAANKIIKFLREKHALDLPVVQCENERHLFIADFEPEMSGNVPSAGYELNITDIIRISAKTPEDIFHGTMTLLQLLEEKPQCPCLLINDSPALERRMIHWDFKGMMTNFEYLKTTIEKLAFYKINTILVEYEDKLQWPHHPNLADKHAALTPEQVRELHKLADDNFIELIPLVQCLGHAEYVLRHREYAGIAESTDNCQQYCPSNPATLELFKDFASQIMALHSSPYIHIGGDETRQLGECPKCKAKAEQTGLIDLYFEYILKICNYVVSQDRIPVVWDDMLCRNFRLDLLRKLPPQTVICCWSYGCFDSGLPWFSGPDHVRPFSEFWLEKNYGKWNERQAHNAMLKRFSGPLERGIQGTWEAQSDGFRKPLEKYLKTSGFPHYFNSFYSPELIRESGLEYWGAGSAHCSGDGDLSPNFTNSLANLKAWCDYLIVNGGNTVIATAWRRGGSLKPPNAPAATYWYAFLALAEWSWSGNRCDEAKFDRKFQQRFFSVADPALTSALALFSQDAEQFYPLIKRKLSGIGGKVEKNQLEFEALQTAADLGEMKCAVKSNLEFCYKYIYQLNSETRYPPPVILKQMQSRLKQAREALEIIPAVRRHLHRYMVESEVEEYLNSIVTPLKLQIDSLTDKIP